MMRTFQFLARRRGGYGRSNGKPASAKGSVAKEIEIVQNNLPKASVFRLAQALRPLSQSAAGRLREKKANRKQTPWPRRRLNRALYSGYSALYIILAKWLRSNLALAGIHANALVALQSRRNEWSEEYAVKSCAED